MRPNNLDRQYQSLLLDIGANGVTKTDRTGTGTLSVFGRQIRHKMSEGFPLLTTKKMAWKSIVTELNWFLGGNTNIKYLVDNNCHIWDGDAYKNYLKNSSTTLDGMHLSQDEFIYHIKNNKEWGDKWGDLGPIYGAQWRKWERYGYKGVQNGALDCGLISQEEADKKRYIDQIANLISELQSNPDSRRLMVSAWNVGELDQMVLPPCHYGFQVYTRELSKFERSRWWGLPEGEHFLDEVLDKYNIPKRAISLMWNQRSVDTFLGLPFNIASYGLLLEMIADEVNMIPDELIGNLGDVHLYLNHIEQAKEQISREPFELPTVHVRDGIESFGDQDVILENYKSHPSIKAPLSN
jgi:thymidylate synthase